jgi:uncharacterized membrane protein YgaE (UPF0421/DUF939 family)
MSDRVKSFLIYAAKCVAGTLTVFLFSRLTNYTDVAWCLISVMLVLSPDGKDSLPLAVTRIKANFTGVGVGVLCLLISPGNMWMMSAGLTVTLALCYLMKLDTGIRSALAATIIIVLHEEGRDLKEAAMERIISVIAGCLLALAITFLFHNRFTQDEPGKGLHQEA